MAHVARAHMYACISATLIPMQLHTHVCCSTELDMLIYPQLLGEYLHAVYSIDFEYISTGWLARWLPVATNNIPRLGVHSTADLVQMSEQEDLRLNDTAASQPPCIYICKHIPIRYQTAIS